MAVLQKREDTQRKLLIWDAEGPPPEWDSTTILWRRYASAETLGAISITQQVEDHAEALRARYLAWIHDLGEAQIVGRRVVDHLAIRPGFSYWWMTSLAQKFNAAGTSGINDAIKALALEMLVSVLKPKSIVLMSGNHRLAACMQLYCDTMGLGYEFRPAVNPQGRRLSLYRSLPLLWQSLIYFAWYVFKSIPLLLTCKPVVPVRPGDLLFVDILVHLDKRAIDYGRFVSNYWTALIEKLVCWRAKSNWLHVYYRQPTIPSLGKAQQLLARFDVAANGSQFHQLVENSVGFKVFLTVMRDYLKVRRAFVSLHAIGRIRPINSALDLWCFHADEWADSICGVSAMVNCLWLSLFESAVSRLPQQKLGVYILENQPWEMAFVHAWRTAGHGVLIGAPHTTIRFWDLRYHYDARCYERCSDRALPIPDLLAVNGKGGRDSILAGGYPSERVTEVEALRFLHLLKRLPEQLGSGVLRSELRVLVCGDFLAATNQQIVAWVDIAARSLPLDTVFVFKPHPAYVFNPAQYSTLQFQVTEAPLAELLSDCDVVFASNITSAAVDAYCAGIPLVQMLEGASFNMSPLRGLPGVVYVTNPECLADGLCAAIQRNVFVAEPYFCLDQDLPRWKNLLGKHLSLEESEVFA